MAGSTHRKAVKSGLKNCANSLYICGANRVSCVNEINHLALEKTGCESCRPSQQSAARFRDGTRRSDGDRYPVRP